MTYWTLPPSPTSSTDSLTSFHTCNTSSQHDKALSPELFSPIPTNQNKWPSPPPSPNELEEDINYTIMQALRPQTLSELGALSKMVLKCRQVVKTPKTSLVDIWVPFLIRLQAQKVFPELKKRNYLGFCTSCFVGRDSLKGQSFEHLKQHFMWLQTHSSLSDFNCSDVNAYMFWIHMVVFNSKMCSTAMDGGDSQWQQGYS